MIIPVRYLTQPKTSALIDVSLSVYNASDAIISTSTMTEISTTGVYGVNLTLIGNTYMWGIVSCPTLSLTDIIRLTPSDVTIQDNLTYLVNSETGTWDRVGSRLTYYDTTGTVLAKFDLYDSNGVLTTDPTTVAKRLRV